MSILSPKYRPLALAIFVSMLIWATLGWHAATPPHLPAASWAVLFLLGFCFRQRMVLPLVAVAASLGAAVPRDLHRPALSLRRAVIRHRSQ